MIANSEQQLTIEMDMFWALDGNKMQLQQFFINWVIEHYSSSKPLYLGGAHPDYITSCVKIIDDTVRQDRLLKCHHEEADDCIFFHVSHGIIVYKYKKVVITWPDTDVFISALYHFNRWIFFGLIELWVVSGKSNSKLAVPLHRIIESIDSNVVDILPAAHALPGCDTSSKVGTKLSALQIALKQGYDLLFDFGRTELSEKMISSAERFLVCCVSRNSDFDTFDELRNHAYHAKSSQIDLEKLPPTSSSIRLHIKQHTSKVFPGYMHHSLN